MAGDVRDETQQEPGASGAAGAAHASGEKQPRKKPQRGKKGGRAELLQVRLSAVEKAEVQRRAQEAGYTAATFGRVRLLGDPGERARRAPTVNAEALGQLTAQVAKLGNNVNQIARKLNEGKGYDPRAAERLYQEVGQAMAAIRAAVSGGRGGA
jgi:uncharacterized protein YecE (DUF72 family)